MCKLLRLCFSHITENVSTARYYSCKGSKAPGGDETDSPLKAGPSAAWKGNLAAVMAGEDILNDMEERDRTDQKSAGKRVSGRARRG